MGKSCFDGYLTPECASCEDWCDGAGENRAIGCACHFPIMMCTAFAKMYNEEHANEPKED